MNRVTGHPAACRPEAAALRWRDAPAVAAGAKVGRPAPLLRSSAGEQLCRWLHGAGPKRHWLMLMAGLVALVLASPAFAAPGGQTPQAIPGRLLSLALFPSILLMMTAFLRTIVVLAILRQGVGLGRLPPNQLLVGLALCMTFFIMQPAVTEIHHQALQPFVADSIPAEQAISRAGTVLHQFMLAHTRAADLGRFAGLTGDARVAGRADVPMRVLMPAFATSELKTMLQVGVLLFLPFLVIDLMVASAGMALGMMASPVVVALPFKLLLFVAVDGRALVLASLT